MSIQALLRQPSSFMLSQMCIGVSLLSLVWTSRQYKGTITGNYTCTCSTSHTWNIHRWYSSRHHRTLSMLHCVMESETPCAALLLALNTERVILKTSLIYETAINSQRNPLTTAHTPCAAGCWLSWFVVRCGWVPTYVFVTGCSRCSLRIATLELSTRISWKIFFMHNCRNLTMPTCVACLQNMEV